MDTTEIMLCECSSMEHIVCFGFFEDEPDVYVSVHLAKHSFWKRLVHGIKYIFGHQSKYGDFEEIILGSKQYDKVMKIANHLKEFKEKNERRNSI